MKKQRKLIVLFFMFIFVILLFPIKRFVDKDDKTTVKEYKSILYSILFLNKTEDNYKSKYWEAKIFPFNYIKNR